MPVLIIFSNSLQYVLSKLRKETTVYHVSDFCSIEEMTNETYWLLPASLILLGNTEWRTALLYHNVSKTFLKLNSTFCNFKKILLNFYFVNGLSSRPFGFLLLHPCMSAWWKFHLSANRSTIDNVDCYAVLLLFERFVWGLNIPCTSVLECVKETKLSELKCGNIYFNF